MIWMFMQSSVMDYPGDVSQDTLGLGAYDFAAARMFYGDVTSVYNVQDEREARPAVPVDRPRRRGHPHDHRQLRRPRRHPVPDGPDRHQHEPPALPLLAAPEELQPDLQLPARDAEGSPTGGTRPSTACGTRSSTGRSSPSAACPPSAAPSRSTTWAGTTCACRSRASSAATPPTTAAATPSTPSRKRVRVPYSFASDNWADLGNVSVFRHDNGADPYEQLQFLITTQENRHILDNFRRGRTTFSVRAASDRSYSRYNEKMLDIAGGIGFYANIYKDFAERQGYTFDTLFPYLIESNFKENMIGATLAMDHFTRELSRPESGPHYFMGTANSGINVLPIGMQDATLRSAADPDGNPGNDGRRRPRGLDRLPRHRHAARRPGQHRLRRPHAGELPGDEPGRLRRRLHRELRRRTTTRSTRRSSSPCRRTASSARRGRTSTTPASAPSAWRTCSPRAGAASSATRSPATARSSPRR